VSFLPNVLLSGPYSLSKIKLSCGGRAAGGGVRRSPPTGLDRGARMAGTVLFACAGIVHPAALTMTTIIFVVFCIVYLGMILGSIANIIVVDAAARRGVSIDWRRHARVGVPVTLATLAICALSLWWRAPPA
jgi:hypothetical protein